MGFEKHDLLIDVDANMGDLKLKYISFRIIVIAN